MKQTAVEWYAYQSMQLEIQKAKGQISIDKMLNELSETLKQAKQMESKEKTRNQLFIGKVADIIGFDKTLELLRESNETIK
jgi:hypothetical protein